MKACLVGMRLQNMVLQSDLKSQWRLEMAKRRGMCVVYRAQWVPLGS